MNPLDMMGPEFIEFYLLWGLGLLAAGLLVRALLRLTGEASPSLLRWSPGVYPREGDAYTIALLRGGPREVVRTALGRLFSTGLLGVDGEVLHLGSSNDKAGLVPVESAVLSALSEAPLSARKAESRARSRLHGHLQPLEDDLRQQGLIPSLAQRDRFMLLRTVAMFLVIGLGLAKLAVALLRGRFNVGVLIVLMVVYALAVFFLLRPPLRTRAGDRYLAWLQKSHQGLVSLLTSGRRESLGEMVLVTGIYGLETVPAMAPLKTAFQPPSSGGNGGDSGGGCGGGGCGGGGCGGCGG